MGKTPKAPRELKCLRHPRLAPGFLCARAVEGAMNDNADARIWHHPWLRIHLLLPEMLGTRVGC